MSESAVKVLGELRQALHVYTVTGQQLSDEVKEEELTGKSPSNESYWARDDAGVEVADRAMKLIEAMDRDGATLAPPRADVQTRTDVQTAPAFGLVPRLAQIFGDPMTADQASFTCTEADAIAELLVKVAGDVDAAARWLVGHGPHDEDPDTTDTEDQHHGLDLESAQAWALNL
jgi:hypothetical protein